MKGDNTMMARALTEDCQLFAVTVEQDCRLN